MRTTVSILAAIALVVASSATAGEPTIRLKIPELGEAAYQTFSEVTIPGDRPYKLEIWIEDALSEIQVSTVKVQLNETPMTPFVATYALPRGIRLVVKLGASLSPEYLLRPNAENLLSVAAQDDSQGRYQGRFYLRTDPHLTVAKAGGVRMDAQPIMAAPIQRAPPVVTITSTLPSQTTENFVEFGVEATDTEGLRRVTIMVNTKETEEVMIENGLPVRSKNGRERKGELPGSVTGDGHKLVLSIPVKLKRKDMNTIVVQAENLLGLRTQEIRAIEQVKKE